MDTRELTSGSQEEQELSREQGAWGKTSRARGSIDELEFRDAHQKQPSMFAEYFLALLRRRKLILLFGVSGLMIGVLLYLRTQSVYQARTSLEIESLNSDFMDTRSVAATAVLPSDAVLQTKVKLLSSDSLAERVKLRLRSEPHPNVVRPNDLLSQMAEVLHLKTSKDIPFEKLLDETADSVKVKPIGVSQLLDITCSSWNATFAAQYCNTMVSEFQEADLESRGTQAQRISSWLISQAAEVRQKANDAQHNLELAAGGNGLLLESQTDAIGQDRLRQMQTEMVHAQADRMEKEAELVSAKGAQSEATPDTAAYAASKARLADLQAQVAALVPPLTEANPKVMHLRAQIAEVQTNLLREKSVSLSKLEEGYQSARHREDLLQASYEEMENKVSSSMQKSSEIEILRRDVQSEQQLYQTLLQKSKEAGFASALPASTIRVVDTARVPQLALYPRRIAADVVGGLLGTVLGLILALLLERQSPRLRVPGDASKLLHIGELGVIPADAAQARIGRSLLSPNKTAVLSIRGGGRSTDANWRDEALIAEAYRGTAFSLMMGRRDRQAGAFLVSSPNAGEGKTTVLSNLGIALSKSRLRVVLVDGDLRKSRLHDVLDVDNKVGLRDVLSDGVAAHQENLDKVYKETAYSNLWVLPAGQGDQAVSELLNSKQLELLIGELSNRFDVVLIDSPPMLHIADARIIAGQTQRAILVFRAGVTNVTHAAAARDILLRDRVAITGSVLNDFDPWQEGRIKHYSGYYDYYNASQATEEAVG